MTPELIAIDVCWTVCFVFAWFLGKEYGVI